jgi:hypothetical protein
MKVQINLSYGELLALHKLSKATGSSREQLIVEAIRMMINKEKEGHYESTITTHQREQRASADEALENLFVESSTQKPQATDSNKGDQAPGGERLGDYSGESKPEVSPVEVPNVVEEIYSSGIDNAILEIFRKHDEEIGLQEIQRLFMEEYIENLQTEKSWWLEKTTYGEPRYKQHIRARVRKLTQKGALESPRRGFYKLSGRN